METCTRCGAEMSCWEESAFEGGANLCHPCADEEREHPDFEFAIESWKRLEREPDFNGLGWPGKNRKGQPNLTGGTYEASPQSPVASATGRSCFSVGSGPR